MIELKKIIKSKRESLGLSQGQLADRVGVSRSTISLIELGERSIPLSRVASYADALHCKESELLGVDEVAEVAQELTPDSEKAFYIKKMIEESSELKESDISLILELISRLQE